MNRFVELLLTLLVTIVIVVPALLVALAVTLTSRGPVLYWSERIGRDNKPFYMPKFRTMRIGTPAVATHLLGDAESVLTPVGSFLRRTSLDELPQLWSVARGEMTFVGPRPALFNQEDLIALRTEAGIHRLKPGITGWAQVHGRDALTIPEKVALDRAYLERKSLMLDLRILALTMLKLFGDENVTH
jgi:O-antigen biosynthesis protein WbqP